MIYWVGGDSAWIEPQQMRIIWLVQMLTDTCADGAPTWEKYEPQYKKEHPKATDQEVLDAFNAAFAAILRRQPHPRSAPARAGLRRELDPGRPVRAGGPWVGRGGGLHQSRLSKDDPASTTTTRCGPSPRGLGDQFVAQRDCETDDTIWNDIDPDPNDDDPDTCAPDNKRDLTVFLTAPTTDHTVQDYRQLDDQAALRHHHHGADHPALGHRADRRHPFPLARGELPLRGPGLPGVSLHARRRRASWRSSATR